MKSKLETLVEKKKKEMDLLYFEKYSPLFQDAYSFLSKKKAILYGGTALNELLPTTLKIYNPYTLPDIDVLSPCAEKLAHEMVQHYKKKRHEAVSFTEALHPGTFKVYADGVQIADITRCSKKTYEMLLKKCIVSEQLKIKIAPPTYIRMTLHKMMSQPNDAHRWQNAYDRLRKYYTAFPIKCSIKKRKEKEEETTGVVEAVHHTMPPDTVFFGKKEVEWMLNKDVPFTAPLQMLTSQDLHEISSLLKREIPRLHISPIFPSDEFVLPHVVLSYDKKPVGVIYRLSSCVAFTNYKNQRVAGIHTIIDLLLSMSMSHYAHFKKDRALLECLADELAHIQQTKPSRKKILEQFIIDCYGPSVGIATMKRERALRMIRKRRWKKMENIY